MACAPERPARACAGSESCATTARPANRCTSPVVAIAGATLCPPFAPVVAIAGATLCPPFAPLATALCLPFSPLASAAAAAASAAATLAAAISLCLCATQAARGRCCARDSLSASQAGHVHTPCGTAGRGGERQKVCQAVSQPSHSMSTPPLSARPQPWQLASPMPASPSSSSLLLLLPAPHSAPASPSASPSTLFASAQ